VRGAEHGVVAGQCLFQRGASSASTSTAFTLARPDSFSLALRAMAVTVWPRRSASSRRRPPARPVAPMMAMWLMNDSRKWMG
jgi:hypothetical protein